MDQCGILIVDRKRVSRAENLKNLCKSNVLELERENSYYLSSLQALALNNDDVQLFQLIYIP